FPSWRAARPKGTPPEPLSCRLLSAPRTSALEFRYVQLELGPGVCTQGDVNKRLERGEHELRVPHAEECRCTQSLQTQPAMRRERRGVERRDPAQRPSDAVLRQQRIGFVPKPGESKAEPCRRLDEYVEIPRREPFRRGHEPASNLVLFVGAQLKPQETKKAA